MVSNALKKRLSLAIAAAAFVAVLVPGVALAAPGGCEDRISNAILFAMEVNGTPMGGPTETWGWAHPDGKQPTPGQAIQYFCN